MKLSAFSFPMFVTADDSEICGPAAERQQHPAIDLHAVVASFGKVSSGFSRNTTSQPSFRRVAAGVADPCGPMATLTAPDFNSRNHICGTRSSGGGQR